MLCDIEELGYAKRNFREEALHHTNTFGSYIDSEELLNVLSTRMTQF